MRFSGSTTSILVMRSFASAGKSAGIMKRPLLTFCNSNRMFSSSKGNRPVSKANSMTPQDQMSLAAP